MYLTVELQHDFTCGLSAWLSSDWWIELFVFFREKRHLTRNTKLKNLLHDQYGLMTILLSTHSC